MKKLKLTKRFCEKILIPILIIGPNMFAQNNSADPGYNDHSIDVKFIEGSQVRIINDSLISKEGYDLKDFYAALDQFYPYPEHRWIFPLFERPVEELESEHELAEQMSGQEIPDLTLFFRIIFTDSIGVKEFISTIYSLDVVEYATQVPLPMLLPSTPDYSSMQGYLGSSVISNGLDIQYAREFNGSYGQYADGPAYTIDIVDVEYDWNFSHEDISQASTAFVGGLTYRNFFGVPRQDFIDHGTAVIGLLCGDYQTPNIGIGGLVPDANLVLYGVYWQNTMYNLANSINFAQSIIRTGGVILIEQQLAGPNYTGSPMGTQFGLVPAEWNQPVYAAILNATALGLIVVEAGGNGQQDLDSNTYQNFYPNGFYPFNRNLYNSGGLIVGAGTPSRVPEWFTNYGSRIDMQAWGSSVVTTGYGDLYQDPANLLDQDKWYTSSFGGTSSASNIIAGCSVMLQAINMVEYGTTLNAQQMRFRLLYRATQRSASSLWIGPRPNMKGTLGAQISGFVFEDLNGNGVFDPGEPGLPLSTVKLEGTTLLGKPIQQDILCSGSYLTNYVVHGLYTVSVTPQPDYIQTYPAAPGSYNLTVLSGQAYGNINFGFRNTTHVEESHPEISSDFKLFQNYPNPFNPSTTIQFNLPRSKFVTLKVYDPLGKEVATLIDDHYSSGQHEFVWHAEGLSSGTYFYRLDFGDFVETRKFIFEK